MEKNSSANIGKGFIAHDIWFNPSSQIKGANGEASYYICEFIDRHHLFEDSGKRGRFCNFKMKPMEEVECGLDCPKFGYCSSCSGFSAIRCQECDIIRE